MDYSTPNMKSKPADRRLSNGCLVARLRLPAATDKTVQAVALAEADCPEVGRAAADPQGADLLEVD